MATKVPAYTVHNPPLKKWTAAASSGKGNLKSFICVSEVPLRGEPTWEPGPTSLHEISQTNEFRT